MMLAAPHVWVPRRDLWTPPLAALMARLKKKASGHLARKASNSHLARCCNIPTSGTVRITFSGGIDIGGCRTCAASGVTNSVQVVSGSIWGNTYDLPHRVGGVFTQPGGSQYQAFLGSTTCGGSPLTTFSTAIRIDPRGTCRASLTVIGTFSPFFYAFHAMFDTADVGATPLVLNNLIVSAADCYSSVEGGITNGGTIAYGGTATLTLI